MYNRHHGSFCQIFWRENKIIKKAKQKSCKWMWTWQYMLKSTAHLHLPDALWAGAVRAACAATSATFTSIAWAEAARQTVLTALQSWRSLPWHVLLWWWALWTKIQSKHIYHRKGMGRKEPGSLCAFLWSSGLENSISLSCDFDMLLYRQRDYKHIRLIFMKDTKYKGSS